MSVLSQGISSYFRPRFLHVSCRGTRWVVLSTPCPSTIPASLCNFHLEESNSRRLVTQNHHHHKREARREHDWPQSNTAAQARTRGAANSGRLFCRCHWRPRNRCHNTDDVSWRSLCFLFLRRAPSFPPNGAFLIQTKSPCQSPLWIVKSFLLPNCQFCSVSQLCQWKWVCSPTKPVRISCTQPTDQST